MRAGSTSTKVIAALGGVTMVAVAVYSVFFVDWTKEPPPEPVVIRPLKTMVIESPFAAAGRRYPGKVAPNERVDLAFQVSGQLIEFNVKKGDDVTKGQLLAKLDPRDFKNTLANKKAKQAALENDYKRLKGLAERNMASPKEAIDAKAAFEAITAEVNIAKKAFDDTSLFAPFTGVIADTYADNFQNVNALAPVVSLQDVEQVEVVVGVPEERVVRSRKGEERGLYRFVATFEYLPDREFEILVKEFSTDADPVTQMYEATFVMPAPEGATILPGMTVTVREYKIEVEASEAIAYAIPIEAAPVDDEGRYFVWIVSGAEGETATVHRTPVQVGDMVQDDILVVDGLKQGDRIALAGVHLLQEGQKVRPFTATQDAMQ